MRYSIPLSEGLQVEWTSLSKGSSTTKRGTIAAVLQPGERPNPRRFPALHRNAGSGRKHISYVVLVDTRAYWPLTGLLHLVPFVASEKS
jgi:hypothetical protein